MIGMDARTGAAIGGTDHLEQSVADILTTPIGSCVMRRDYGSMLFDLLDAPMNALSRLRLFAATADALRRWEPRLRLDRVAIADPTRDGRFALSLEGERLDAPDAPARFRFSIPVR